MKKVLIFSPYGFWVCHILFERLVAKGLVERGHETQFLYCDGVFQNCDLKKKCFICRASRQRIDGELDVQAEPMSKYLHDDTAHFVGHSTSENELLHFHYKGIDVSHAIAPTYCSYFRKDVATFENDLEKKVYIELINSAIMVFDCLENHQQKFSSNLAIVFNGRFFASNMAIAFFKARNIDFVAHELGVSLDSFLVSYNTNIFYFKDILSKWELVKNLPISKMDVLKSITWLRQWRLGKNRAGNVFIKPQKIKNSLVTEIKDKSKKYNKTVLIMTSSTDEFVYIDGFKQFFDSQVEWLEKTVEYFKDHPEYLGIIRVHPNTINADGELKSIMDFVRSSGQDLPSNVAVIHPGQKINTYDLMQMSDAGVTYGSTTTLEMMAFRKKVMVVRECMFYFLPFFERIHSKEEYFDKLHEMIGKQVSVDEVTLFYRYISYYVTERSLRFPYIRFLDHSTSFMNFSSFEKLGDRKFLDDVVDKILHYDQSMQTADQPKNLPSETEYLENLRLLPKKLRQVVILSDETEMQFQTSRGKTFELYEKMILKKNSIPEIVFCNDEEWLQDEFSKLGGYAGYFSKWFRLYYKTLFRSPILIPINKVIRRTAEMFFRKHYGSARIIRTLVDYHDPSYIISLMGKNELQNKLGRLSNHKVIYTK